MYFGRVHIYTDSLGRCRVGSGDGHAKKSGSFMTGLVSLEHAGHFPESLLIITGSVGVFESICVMDGFERAGIGMMGLANTTILLGDSVGRVRGGGTIWCF